MDDDLGIAEESLQCGTLDLDALEEVYPQLLREYLFGEKTEEALYEAYKMSMACIAANIDLEYIIDIHGRAVRELTKDLPIPEQPWVILKSNNVLLEVMVKFNLFCRLSFDALEKLESKNHWIFLQASRAFSSRDLGDILSAILELVNGYMEVPASSIHIPEDRGTSIGLRENGYRNEKNTPLWETIKSGKIHVIQDTRETLLTLPRLENGEHPGSILSLPLKLEGKTIGALELYSRLPRTYDEKELELLLSFTANAARAIEKAEG
ncbi:MAG: phosphatase RsbU N-terminal domain-containing protein [Candidatus Syntropharchaeales archaeon]